MCTYEWHCYNPIISEYDGLSEYMPPKAGHKENHVFSQWSLSSVGE